MDGVAKRPTQAVEIVAWTFADDTALCALVMAEGVVWGAANTRMPDRAVRHIRYHAARGFVGPMVCSVDCPEEAAGETDRVRAGRRRLHDWRQDDGIGDG